MTTERRAMAFFLRAWSTPLYDGTSGLLVSADSGVVVASCRHMNPHKCRDLRPPQD